MSRHEIVKGGVAWPHVATPNSRRMIAHLERNEALVTWVQPVGGGVTDQFPTMRIRDEYYTLSLRMMKSIWKHIKLKKNFVNRETIPHVGVKLRIPEVLLVEKMRTQQRFNVSGARPPPFMAKCRILMTRFAGPQVMREASYERTQKTVVRRRMDDVLLQIILCASPPLDVTYFNVQEDESLQSIVDQLKRDCPRWCADVPSLLSKIDSLLCVSSSA